jgi:hypothetical protein
MGGEAFQLLNATTGAVVTTAQSDATGTFAFPNVPNLPGGGAYRVRPVPRAGWVTTTPDPADVTPVSGQDVSAGLVFGAFRLVAVRGTKFFDLDADGARDPDEPGAPGFVIHLDRNADGTTDATATTAADGTYAFPGLGPGTHRVTEPPRRGYVPTAPSGGAYTVTTASGQDAGGRDFAAERRQVTVTAPDAGGPPVVTVRDAGTDRVRLTIHAYDLAFTGGVRVAVGYFNADLVPDVVTVAGAGGGPHVRVFDGQTGAVLREFFAYDPAFRGGVFVAAADVDGDGTDDVITGPGLGGGPHVRVFGGADGRALRDFMAYDPAFRGGVTVAAGAVNGDRFADVITGAGPGGGPHVKVFSGSNLGLLSSFMAYAVAFRGGVFVAAGDVNGDGRADVVTGPGHGGGPHVQAFDALTRQVLVSHLAFADADLGPYAGGARVASYDVNLDGSDDILAAPGRGLRPRVRIVSRLTLPLVTEFNAADPAFLGGVFVAGR